MTYNVLNIAAIQLHIVGFLLKVTNYFMVDYQLPSIEVMEPTSRPTTRPVETCSVRVRAHQFVKCALDCLI